MTVAYLNRTLDQELIAIVRGVSLECLVCGEFLLHANGGVIACPECGSSLVDGLVAAGAGEQELLSSG